VAAELDAGFSSLLGGDVGAARQVARRLLAELPGLAPARVLAAQADLVAGDVAAAVAALEPVVREAPLYAAAQLALGRAAERQGDLVRAYAALRAVAETNPPAAARAAALEPRVLEVLGRRVAAAVTAGELTAADEALGRLRRWSPGSETTLRAALAVAAARGDRRGELAALFDLTARLGLDERPLLERRAELELEVGDPGAGLDLYEELARRFPGEAGIAEGLAAAKFRWRVAQFPDRVRQAAAAEELQRGDFAVLLYWLVPPVRYGRAGTARIASDILDDPRREEIARVVNVGLLDVDSTVHRFYPETPIRRDRALRALLRLLGDGGTPCAVGLPADPDREALCGTALACGLVRQPDECSAGEGVSGVEGVELVRRAVDLLAGP
jgi:tetratricopeptide (TPR) repeat protein